MSAPDWAAALWQGVTFALDPNVGRDGAVRLGPEHIIVGPRIYRALLWEVEGKGAWEGRDWRRIKRERRKFVSQP